MYILYNNKINCININALSFPKQVVVITPNSLPAGILQVVLHEKDFTEQNQLCKGGMETGMEDRELSLHTHVI